MRKRHAIIALVVLAAVGVLAAVMLGGDDSEPTETTATAEPIDGPILSGRIIDTSGRPLAGAYVFAAHDMARADAQGRFEFFDLPREEVPIDATAEGHLRAGVDARGRPIIDLANNAPVDDLELILPRAASLSGRVVAGGQPVEGADISLSYVFAESLDGSDLEPFIVSDVAQTEDTGEFSLDQLAPGRLQIFVDADDYDFAESDEIYFRAGQHRDGLVIDVAPAGRLQGTTIDSRGVPIAAEVTVIPWEPHLLSRTMATDGDGQFSFSRLEESTYTIRAEAPDHRVEELSDVSIDANRITEVELVLEATRGLLGRVVEPDGTPVANARVVIENDDDRQRLRTDTNGRFSWDDAPAGRWRATASSPGHAASDEQLLRPDEEATLVVTPGGSIVGQVVDPRGDPVQNYEIGVSFMELEGEMDRHYQNRHMASDNVSNPAGEFELGPLLPGRFRLIVTADGYPPATTNAISVSPASTSGPITIELEPHSSLGGIVVDQESGEPVAGAQIIFVLQTPGNRSPRTTSDEEGHFQIDSLPSGRSSIRVIHNEYIYELLSGIELPRGGHLEYDIELEPIGDGEPGQSFQGIGASLQRSDGGFEIVSTHDDTPAAAAGLREGDVITGVEGQSVEEMTLDQVVEYIRGEPGVPVTLDVHRSGRGTRSIEVGRERIVRTQQRQVR